MPLCIGITTTMIVIPKVLIMLLNRLKLFANEVEVVATSYSWFYQLHGQAQVER